MSEFQYYEFKAIDRSLTKQERAELRAISSRAEITATSFTNEYNWGNLKAEPSDLVERYFDAHFYLSNWGSRVLILRFPVAVVPLSALAPYRLKGALDVWSTNSHTLVKLCCDEEDIDEWWEDQDALDELIPLRQQIMSGDYRCLYMAWLDAAVRSFHMNQRLPKGAAPCIPPGLGTLDSALERFAEVFWLDYDALEVAARHSPAPIPSEGAQRERALRAFIAGLDAKAKDALLLRVARQDQGVGVELMASFRSAQAAGRQAVTPPLRAIIEEAERARQVREAQEAARARQEAEARARAEAERLNARRRALRDGWRAAWGEVSDLIDRRNREDYRQAARLIAELKDAATEDPYKLDFTRRLGELRTTRQRLTAFMDELKKAGLASW